MHPNKERAEEYSHLPLEQCKRVYDDLVNKYKSLAKKIDERINWSELDQTANQISAERHKLNYRLRGLEEEEEKCKREERKEERAREERARAEREERARVAKRDREERSRVEKEESRVEKEGERARVIRQKIEGGKKITIYVNMRAIDRMLGPIKLDVNSWDSILRVKSKLESVVGLTTHEMIISNASDEEMSDEKSLAMCRVEMGSFVIIKRRSC